MRKRYLWFVEGENLQPELNFVLLERERTRRIIETPLLINIENSNESIRDLAQTYGQGIEMPPSRETRSAEPEQMEETSLYILHETDQATSESTSEDPGFSAFVLLILKLPLDTLFRFTCPQTKIGSKFELLYPVAFICSFLWIAGFSFVISTVVEDWVRRTGISETFFGLTLVALGAEIPDTIQSVSVASRGYGSMAVANCIGSQVVNLCIGLGLSWLLGIVTSTNLRPIKITPIGVSNIFIAASCQGLAVLLVILLLFGPVVASRFTKKIILNKFKGYALVGAYCTTMVIFGVLMFARRG